MIEKVTLCEARPPSFPSLRSTSRTPPHFSRRPSTSLLAAEMHPVGLLEEKLVLRLANAFLRIQRSERYERGVLVSEGCSEPNVGLGLAFIRTVVKGDTLSKALKHGMAAERSVWSILSCLDRLRAARMGQPVPVPAVIDININTPEAEDDPSPA